MTILLTGGTGFLGSHLVRTLSARGHRVLAYVRPDSLSIRPKGAEWFPLERGRESSPFQQGTIDAIIHTATCYGRMEQPVSMLLEVNLLLPVLLANLAMQFKVPLFINTDTYFNIGDEGYSLLPDYSLSKHHALHWLKRCSSGTGLRLANMKLEHMYGPGDRPEKFCPSVLNALAHHVPELPMTTGEQCRDFIYVDDVVAGFLTVLENWKGAAGETAQFGVGWGTSVPIRHFVTLGHRIANSRTKLCFGALPSRPADFADSRAENNCLRSLGWTPRTGLEDGIRQTLAYL